MSSLFYEDCEGCYSSVERVFRDSWTGKELCAFCLSRIINKVTDSPCSEGDNLIKLMIDYDMVDEDDLVEGDAPELRPKWLNEF